MDKLQIIKNKLNAIRFYHEKQMKADNKYDDGWQDGQDYLACQLLAIVND